MGQIWRGNMQNMGKENGDSVVFIVEVGVY